MWRIGKTYTFEAAHRLPTAYTKKCLRWHGHTYRVTVELESDKLGPDGMVLDFGLISEVVKREVVDVFDHSRLNDHMQTPTAENLAKHIYDKLKPHLPGLVAVTVQEGEGGWARYEKQ